MNGCLGSYKISPKPCTVKSQSSSSGEVQGTCMFVWECLKSEGKHLGMCVDGFMFGSCCSHNVIENTIEGTGVVGTSGHHSTSSLHSTSPATTTTTLVEVLGGDGGFSNSAGEEDEHTNTASYPFLSQLHPHHQATNSVIELIGGITSTAPTISISDEDDDNEDVFGIPFITRVSTTTAPPPTTTSTRATTTTTTTTTATTTTTSTTTTPAPTSRPHPGHSMTPVMSTSESTSDTCGISVLHRTPQPQMRIVGGSEAKYGQFPWQVSVRRTSFFGFSSTHRCGGALINEQWVATAGHCVDDLMTSQIKIRLGEFDFSNTKEVHAHVERGIKKKVSWFSC